MFFYKDGRINWDDIASLLKKVDDSFLEAKHADFLIDKQNELLNSFLKKYLDLLSFSRNIYVKSRADLSVPLLLDGAQSEISFFREEITDRDGSFYRYEQRGSLPLLPDCHYSVSLRGLAENVLVRLYEGNGMDRRERECLKSGKRENSLRFFSGGASTWFTFVFETRSPVEEILAGVEISTLSVHKIIENGAAPVIRRDVDQQETSAVGQLLFLQQKLRAATDLSSYPLYWRCREALERGEFRNWMKNLRIAAIMDEFTFQSYAPEANLLQLGPDNWQAEIEKFKPDLLFVESAWKGRDELWAKRLNASSEPLLKLLEWCRFHKIPSIFWNKEDPVHFDLFLPLAGLFDAIFTHDQDCVERYKKATGKNNVFHLHFGVQPMLFNPIEKYDRIDGFSFAGSYYVKYPERCRNLREFVQAIKQIKPVDIYDRQLGKGNERLTYPEFFQPHLKGGLPYSEIDKAYKGYKYAINMNSFKQSQSQCARRIYELLACNTAVVSNFSRGARQIFGDLVFNGDSGEELARWIKNMDSQPREFDKYRLLALRKVMSGNLYEDRLAGLLCSLASVDAPDLSPAVICVGQPENLAEAKAIISSYKRQTWKNRSLLLIFDNPANLPPLNDNSITAVSRNEFESKAASLDTDWFAWLSASDWYGENYLTDLMLATRYAQFSMAGKGKFFKADNGEIVLLEEARPYSWAQALNVSSSILSRRQFLTVLKSGQKIVTDEEGILSLDYLNYCQNGADFDEVELEKVCGDLQGVYMGAEKGIHVCPDEPEIEHAQGQNILSGERLFAEFDDSDNQLLEKEMDAAGNPVFVSRQAEGETAFFQGRTYFPIRDILGANNFLSIFVDADSGANAFIQYKIYDENGRNLKNGKKLLRKNDAIPLASSYRYIKFDLGLTGFGKLSVRGLIFGDMNISLPRSIHSPHRNLLVTGKGDAAGVARLISRHSLPNDLEIFILDEKADPGFSRCGQYDSIIGNGEILKKVLAGQAFDKVFLGHVHPMEAGAFETLFKDTDLRVLAEA